MRRVLVKKRIRGYFPSKPGEPPRKQTGHLRRSVTYEVDARDLTARVGIPGGAKDDEGNEIVTYGRALELGTRRGLAPRPFLRKALANVWSRVNDILRQIGPER